MLKCKYIDEKYSTIMGAADTALSVGVVVVEMLLLVTVVVQVEAGDGGRVPAEGDSTPVLPHHSPLCRSHQYSDMRNSVWNFHGVFLCLS